MSKAINYFNGGRILMSITKLPFKCPVAPYETAVTRLLSQEEVYKDKVDMIFFTSEPYPIPVAGPE